jgi:hypothetical protein
MDASPLGLIEAARDAGYDGLGLRLHPSPKLPYHPVVGDAPLMRRMQRTLSDAKLQVLDIYTFYLEPPTQSSARAMRWYRAPIPIGRACATNLRDSANGRDGSASPRASNSCHSAISRHLRKRSG